VYLSYLRIIWIFPNPVILFLSKKIEIGSDEKIKGFKDIIINR
jgi:hypothetical protein